MDKKEINQFKAQDALDQVIHGLLDGTMETNIARTVVQAIEAKVSIAKANIMAAAITRTPLTDGFLGIKTKQIQGRRPIT